MPIYNRKSLNFTPSLETVCKEFRRRSIDSRVALYQVDSGEHEYRYRLALRPSARPLPKFSGLDLFEISGKKIFFNLVPDTTKAYSRVLLSS